ncbi:insulin [Dendrobates tinctorius]|uniref:insulin n=1 Tax=Dendrobates tinctorius TaxID=92724 RepID=UPI003CC9605C
MGLQEKEDHNYTFHPLLRSFCNTRPVPPSISFIMVLWIQCLPLAVLLILFTPITQARPSVPSDHLCGYQLVEELIMVCGERGFYRPKVRRVNGAQGHDYPRGIVERCCIGKCSYYDLLDYCD